MKLTKAYRIGTQYIKMPECGSDDDLACIECGKCLHEGCDFFVISNYGHLTNHPTVIICEFDLQKMWDDEVREQAANTIIMGTSMIDMDEKQLAYWSEHIKDEELCDVIDKFRLVVANMSHEWIKEIPK